MLITSDPMWLFVLLLRAAAAQFPTTLRLEKVISSQKSSFFSSPLPLFSLVTPSFIALKRQPTKRQWWERGTQRCAKSFLWTQTRGFQRQGNLRKNTSVKKSLFCWYGFIFTQPIVTQQCSKSESNVGAYPRPGFHICTIYC